MFNTILIAKVLVLHRLYKKVVRKKRTGCIRPIYLKRNIQGEFILVDELRSDPEYHFRYFRMNVENFDELLERVRGKLSHPGTHSRPITAVERLAITLRYLATGNSQISLSFSFRISRSSVSNIVRETMKALCDSLKEEYLPSPTEETWIKNEKKFSKKWNFPNSCGAVDGKHVRIRAPGLSGSNFYNYKDFFSVVLFAIANANYQFTAVDIGCAGSESDGGILLRSNIGRSLATNSLKMPAPKPIVPTGELMPQIILGDSGFPLKPYLLTPFKGDSISKEKKIFNYRLSRARMVVENSFGILAARFRIFHTPINADLDLVKLITLTSVLLHNYLTSKSDFNTITVDSEENDEFVPGSWREITAADTGMIPLANQGSNNYSNSAAEIRLKFLEYFNGVGKLAWQETHVNR